MTDRTAAGAGVGALDASAGVVDGPMADGPGERRAVAAVAYLEREVDAAGRLVDGAQTKLAKLGKLVEATRHSIEVGGAELDASRARLAAAQAELAELQGGDR